MIRLSSNWKFFGHFHNLQYRIISTQAFKDIIPFIINKLNCKQQVQLFLKSNGGLLDQQNIELLRMTNKALSSSNLSFTHYFIVFKDSAEKKCRKSTLHIFRFGWTLHSFHKHKDSLSYFEAFLQHLLWQSSWCKLKPAKRDTMQPRIAAVMRIALMMC